MDEWTLHLQFNGNVLTWIVSSLMKLDSVTLSLCPVLEKWPAQEMSTPEGWLGEEMYLHGAMTVVWLDGNFTLAW